MEFAVYFVTFALFITTAVVFPVTAAKKSRSVLRGVGFAVYTAALIIALIAVFLLVGFNIVSVINFLDESLYIFSRPFPIFSLFIL